jgi:hypothetical protein
MTPPRLYFQDGTVASMKWLALALMAGDHINKYLFNGTVAVLFNVGRLAMPIFVCILGFNLARPGAFARGTYGRTIRRLSISGVIASVPFIALGGLYGGWWPLNVLFALLVVAGTACLLEYGHTRATAAALALYLVGGGLVEYWWPGVTLGLAVWAYTKRPTWAALGVAVLACASLSVINGNHWALAALPLLAAGTRVDIQAAPARWLFYSFYPVHLAALWLARIPMRCAGYLFF